MIIGKKVNKITSSSLADDEKAAKEQEIILLQTETANLSEVSNKATFMADKIGSLLQ